MTKESDEFIKVLLDAKDEWSKHLKDGDCTADEALRGIVFSTLVELDGEGQSAGYDLVSRSTGEVINDSELHSDLFKFIVK